MYDPIFAESSILCKKSDVVSLDTKEQLAPGVRFRPDRSLSSWCFYDQRLRGRGRRHVSHLCIGSIQPNAGQKLNTPAFGLLLLASAPECL